MKKISFMLLTAVALLLLVACTNESTVDPSPTTAVDLPDTTTKDESLNDTSSNNTNSNPTGEISTDPIVNHAPIRSVVMELHDGQHVVMIEGDLPDGCTQIEAVTQEVVGTVIHINLTTSRPQDRMCTQMITPFSEKVIIETGTLAGANYTVEVNGLAVKGNINTSSLD